MIPRFRRLFQRVLEAVLVILMTLLTAVVVGAVAARKMGASLSWADEIASVLLAWVTYYGAALAALRRAHIGFPGVLDRLPYRWHVVALILGEGFVIGFFVLMMWVGMKVLQVLAGETLVSLTWVPLQLTESVIPIGAAFFVVAELLSLPEVLRASRLSNLESHGAAEQPGGGEEPTP